MAWPDDTAEDSGLHEGPQGDPLMPASGDSAPFSTNESGGEEPDEDLLSEVNAVAHHLRELQKRLGSYRPRDEDEVIEGRSPSSVPPPAPNGVGMRPEEASEHVAAIIAAAESAAAEIRARAEATAAEIVANAESAAARIREEARSDERRLFEAIDALRPAAAEFQHALERVHDAAVAALMSYPRS